MYNPTCGKPLQLQCQNRDHRDREGALPLRLYDVIWNEKFVAKIAGKHAISTDEVEAVLFSRPHVRKLEKGR